MKTYVLPFLLLGTVALTACGVDTIGLSPETSRGPHPRSNADSNILVEEFIDLQCEACRAAQTRVIPQLLEQYGSDIRFEIRHFPIYPNHQYSVLAAEAAECAADQGKFWEFEEMDYENQDDLSPAAVREWAQALELDMPLFERCLESHIKRDMIMAEQAEGDERGVNGTPTFFVNGKRVESTVEAIGEAIKAAQSGTLIPL